jgi:hypothetical protein
MEKIQNNIIATPYTSNTAVLFQELASRAHMENIIARRCRCGYKKSGLS